MRILFISLLEINDINEHGLYTDLLREFYRHGHSLTIISPVERRNGGNNKIIKKGNLQIVKVKIGNIQKTNYFEKGLSTLRLSSQITMAIRKACKDLFFDLVLYATPPVTIYKTIKKVKAASGATTLLMLKDIWPQEMVDLGLIKKHGILYKYFSRLEKSIYRISDYIGYTSLANKKYLLSQGVSENKLLAVNNSVDPNYRRSTAADKLELLQKYGINDDQILFFYGGNLGKPQDIDYLIRCLKHQVNRQDRFFIICGQGTEYPKILAFFEKYHPENMALFPYLPKNEYDQLIMLSDVGLVFLNHRFTVPNCPSRFYTYMEYSKPIFACTDKATDIKDDIIEGRFGWWCESLHVSDFDSIIDKICEQPKERLGKMGIKARQYLEKNYTVDKDYKRIIDTIKGI